MFAIPIASLPLFAAIKGDTAIINRVPTRWGQEEADSSPPYASQITKNNSMKLYSKFRNIRSHSPPIPRIEKGGAHVTTNTCHSQHTPITRWVVVNHFPSYLILCHPHMSVDRQCLRPTVHTSGGHRSYRAKWQRPDPGGPCGRKRAMSPSLRIAGVVRIYENEKMM